MRSLQAAHRHDFIRIYSHNSSACAASPPHAGTVSKTIQNGNPACVEFELRDLAFMTQRPSTIRYGLR